MTIARRFHDYQRVRPPSFVGGRCSPALIQLRSALASRWSTEALGCFGERPVRAGVAPSTHSYGAATDLSYVNVGRETAVAEMIPYLVAWSEEWGLQAIHDYVGRRIWRAGRTARVEDACSRWWKAQRASAATGMGQSWATYVHLEVFPDRWADNRTEDERGID